MFELKLGLKESRMLTSALNAADVALVLMIVLFIINFKIMLVDLTGGVPTVISPT